MVRRTAIASAAFVLLAGVALSCSGEDTSSGRAAVQTDVLSDQTTKDIWVTQPDAQGPWPIVVAMHGIGGSGEEMTDLATRLARGGSVVFAPTYQTDWSTQGGLVQAARDVECGYRFVRSIAAQHGGDPHGPVTFVGWSQGATAALAIGLEHIDPSGKFITCLQDAPRPDVIVAVSGCYYEYGGKKVDVDTSGWANRDVRLVLVAGDEDTTCPAWQSKRALGDLRAMGYDVHLVMLHGADHLAPVFHQVVNGESVVRTDDPPGDRLVHVVLDAIAEAQR